MTDIQIIRINDHCRYGLLDITTIEAGTKRDLEAIGIQMLLKALFPAEECRLAYHASGKPYLTSHKEHISISHSHDKVAIMVNDREATGIDIELIRDKVLTIAHKYLGEAEKRDLLGADVEKHLVYWAAKETLFKIHGERNIMFRENLLVESFIYQPVGGEIMGHIILPGNKKSYTLHYQKAGDYILVYPV